ncbi:SDR family NAD(P)-dependent oxidoreductase [Pseudonocardia spinosispora]|uniref:SDR family NAD(P)-dependent oxidoreductase n=1 Tax=Pseudonocardia spinosispora TaxID=103441 RepID=UPI000407E042|nr:SDR family oxidoreductase [Pseudonocardia spinosispora]
MTTSGTALITGASSGIGAVYADRLARRGYDLVLVARNQERLDALAAKLAEQTGRTVDVLVADLGKPEGVAAVEQELRTNSALTLLVNNAGIGALGPLLETDVDLAQRIIELNVTALTRLNYAVAPQFVARGAGAVINIASVVGVVPEMLNGVYGASKSYVLALTQSMHKELADQGVQVQAVLPGATATDFWAIAGNPVENLPETMVMSAQDMVDAALAGFDQGELVTIPALQDVTQWEALESARQTLAPNLSVTTPAARYRTPVTAS